MGCDTIGNTDAFADAFLNIPHFSFLIHNSQFLKQAPNAFQENL